MPVREEPTPSMYVDLVRAFDAAGLGHVIRPAAEALQRRQEIEEEFKSLQGAGHDARPIAAEVAEGRSLREAGVEFAAVAAMFAGPVQMIRDLRDKAKWRCFDNARRWLAEHADEIAIEVETRIGEADGEADGLRSLLDGVGDFEAAVRAGKRQMNAFTRLRDLNEQRPRLYEVRRRLVLLGLVREPVEA